ncbi:cysteine hydrolase family protein [Novosphingobium sp. MBES04]|uniref:cysteine hydrolase family protein n=1 Tax=Novosphingobium sp. MBES04 TaxID=1206458 RepID=UPI00057DFD54|nr:cysteine hydrolase [Novosphingobium sp. MBES04]GAM06110.1 isochorismatase hydrolase [Novosphingobium sp. MBES04]
MHPFHLPDWAVARGQGLNRFDALEPGATALVVIDMQSAFVGEGEVFGKASSRATIPAINALCSALRTFGAPVIWTRQTVSDRVPLAMPGWQYDLTDPEVARAVEALRSGSSSHALHPAMDFHEGDVLLDKYRYGAFSCPDGALARALARRGIEMVVLVGTLTNVCVDSTAREANMRGYKVLIAADACSAVTDAEQDAALLNLRLNFADVKSCAQVLEMTKGAAP